MAGRFKDKMGTEIKVGDTVRFVTEFQVQLLQDQGGDAVEIIHHDGTKVMNIKCVDVERIPTVEEIADAEAERVAAEEAAGGL